MSKLRTNLIYAAWWAFCFAEHFFLLSYYGFDFKISVTDALFSVGTLGLLAIGTNHFYRYYQHGKDTRVFLPLWGVALAAVCTTAQFYFLKWLHVVNADYLQFLNSSLPVRGLFCFLVISFFTLISWLLAGMQEKARGEEKKSMEIELAKEAELARLRQQLQPHFLFNSLNSVNALIGADPAQARKMVQALSDFMRMNLRKDDQLIPLEEELKHLELYLQIEKVRFGHRLNVSVEAEESLKKAKLPPLLLQPVVENAIKFGLYNVTGEVNISVKARLSGSVVEIITENPFDPETSAAGKGTGFGLASVQRRLFLIYGRNDLLRTDTKEKIFITTILIPFKNQS